MLLSSSKLRIPTGLAANLGEGAYTAKDPLKISVDSGIIFATVTFSEF